MAKAENVVNPPQNPAMSKGEKWVVCSGLEKYPAKIPISKHPKIFTTNVPKGNPVCENFSV